jgi:hypothetical protein
VYGLVCEGQWIFLVLYAKGRGVKKKDERETYNLLEMTARQGC